VSCFKNLVLNLTFKIGVITEYYYYYCTTAAAATTTTAAAATSTTTTTMTTTVAATTITTTTNNNNINTKKHQVPTCSITKLVALLFCLVCCPHALQNQG
jgi:beta-lactamase regulating signal transducer with metallopeptidase domain